MIRKSLSLFVLAALFCSLVSPSRADQAHPNLTILYSFQNGNDGSQPLGDLIADKHGNLYGTTAGLGGPVCPTACGNVFKLSPPARTGDAWSFSVIYDFTGGSDGGSPHGNVIFGPDGDLYGSNVRFGGLGGGGVIFKLKPPSNPNGAWTERTIHSFGVGKDGNAPQGGLVFDSRGNLYGTTFLGGKLGIGVVFELTPPARRGGNWTETILHSFGIGFDGFYPEAGLALNRAGDLFGTAQYGGNSSSYCESGCGTVYEISHDPARSYSTIWAFDGLTDGATPSDPLIFDKAGNIYGTTLDGQGGPQSGYGGTAFELSPPVVGKAPWLETVLYRFPQYQFDAGYSYAGLIFDGAGNLYGTSQSGGPRFEGTAYKLSPPAKRGGAWSDAILHNFNKNNGGATYPSTALVFGVGGALYGTTPYGGSGNCTLGKIKGCGTIFEITP